MVLFGTIKGREGRESEYQAVLLYTQMVTVERDVLGWRSVETLTTD